MTPDDDKILYKAESFAIVGACMAVYNDKGAGFLEPVYQECMEIELAYQKIPAMPQVQLKLSYRGRELKQRYVPDFVCYDKIILELKAVARVTNEHRAQVLNYLNATGYRLGLLVNFGHDRTLEWERIVL